ncbi:MAG: Fis family transcriptional regulator [Zetaproteobacteria bacterium]|nr:Fis family transcriptional regulator [Zetaproteobacteria bacterium]
MNSQASKKPITMVTAQGESHKTKSMSKPNASLLDQYSLDEIIAVKISRFIDQIAPYYPENVHGLIMSKAEKPLLEEILKRTGGNQLQAARILGINRNTLRKKIKTYKLLGY